MHIQKNAPYGTYKGQKNYSNRPGRKRRRIRRIRKLRNCILCFSVFALTLTAASELQLLKLQSGSKLHFVADAVSRRSKQQVSTNDTTDTTGEQLADTTVEDETATHITSVSKQWNLVLVNPWNPLPDDHEIFVTPLENGQSIDSRCYSQLMEMLQSCRDAGLDPLICSSYRTHEKQISLFEERVGELLAQGYTKEDARTKAATSVARPGTSEHELGLAVDIVDRGHQLLDYTQEYTLVQQWLLSNSWKYGFILRYPNDKSSITGIIYEPWHYRYVGKKVAKKIYKQDICLEEYLAKLQKSN